MNGIEDAIREYEKDFVAEQVPDICRELVVWGRTIHTTGAVFFVACAILGASYLLRRRYDIAKVSRGQYPKDAVPVLVVSTIVSMVALLVGVAAGSYHVYQALMVWFAPKVYLIHLASDLVKK